ncbi:MAG: YceI family protein [Deltaproteobacteria bacterium]|nr:YceI family protein [Deltaproteobacteria bacterium]
MHANLKVFGSSIVLLFLSCFSMISPALAQDSMQHYQIDPQNSHFFVYTGSGGVFGAFGHKHKIAIPGITGQVNFDPKDPTKSTLDLKIDPMSLILVADSKAEKKDKAEIETNMRAKVLEPAKFPGIEFRSTRISAISSVEGEYDAEIHGDLSFHGVSRNIPLKAKVKLGEDRLTAIGEFTLKQSDYQIQPVSAAGGTIKVKDEVRLTFEIATRP